MTATIIIVMVIYFTAMIVISWFGRKHSSTFDDYLSAGKSAGLVMVVGGAMGAHIGNGLVVGGAGEGATVGLSGAMYGLGCCLSFIILAFLLSDFVYKGGYMSLSDYLRKRYNNEIPAQIYNIATTLSYIGMVAGQLMAGKALFEALGFNGALGVVIIALVVFIYSQISGLWGAFATSAVQSAIIALGLITSAVYLLQNGAWQEILNAVDSGIVPENYTSLIGGYDTTALLIVAVPITLEILTDQCSYLRINSAKSAKVSKIAHILAAIIMIPLCIIPTIIGMYGAVKYGAVGNQAFFAVILNVLPPIIAALIITAVIAAVMSTIDGFFISFSQVLIKDIYQQHIDKNASDKKLSKMTLGLNIIVTVISIVFALKATSLVGLLSSTYMFLLGASLVPFLAGRFWKGGTASGAVASSIVGVFFVVLEMAGIYVLPYSAVTIFVPSFVAYVVVSLITMKKKPEVQQ